ncbi:hypothetical protein JCM9140_1374 [Halalkalibacter wakoensis JCM 9140]|uniref:Uncharacterized protein n=1 Tax=Halalkalibacter wakoensis JCM 9140 TaxID=1236970 RepID=W4Q0Y5_9BACI|nr:hypothetical protein [Halalkalibacter wakoensis]GAE25383.1 hypothetical protein JCM9140_1374 [Halalkalibacter wakoensis JCM 9140]
MVKDIKRIQEITPIQSLLAILVLAVLVVSFLLASQSYFSYIEVTKIANSCYDAGGFPVIVKSGVNLAYFDCIE